MAGERNTPRDQAFAYIDSWLKTNQRPFRFDYYIQEIEDKGIRRLYGNTNMYPAELRADPELMNAYTTILSAGLERHNLIPPGKTVQLSIAEGVHLGEDQDEGFALVEIDFVDPNSSPSDLPTLPEVNLQIPEAKQESEPPSSVPIGGEPAEALRQRTRVKRGRRGKPTTVTGATIEDAWARAAQEAWNSEQGGVFRLGVEQPKESKKLNKKQN